MMGYGCIQIQNDKIDLVEKGVLNFSSYGDAFQKLSGIFQGCTNILHKCTPEEVAIEGPFFGKNVQSMLKLGRAQGVAIAAMVANEKPVFEYAPRKIKQAITGNGNASKLQVAGMINHLVTQEPDWSKKELDATDAVATAICHHFQTKTGSLPQEGAGSWEKFIRENPDKLG